MPEGANVEIAHSLTEQDEHSEQGGDHHDGWHRVLEILEVGLLGDRRHRHRVERLPGSQMGWTPVRALRAFQSRPIRSRGGHDNRRSAPRVRCWDLHRLAAGAFGRQLRPGGNTPQANDPRVQGRLRRLAPDRPVRQPCGTVGTRRHAAVQEPRPRTGRQTERHRDCQPSTKAPRLAKPARNTSATPCCSPWCSSSWRSPSA